MLRTHDFLLAQHRVLAEAFPCQEGVVSLSSMPIFVLADLACGITSLIAAGDLQHPGRIDPWPILEQMHTYRPVRASGSPAFWARLASYCERRRLALSPGLQALYTGGGPVFPPLLDRLAALAPQAEVVSVYGSTEAEPIAKIARHALGAGDLERMRQGFGVLAGAPVPEIDLRILADPAGTHLGAACTAAEFADHVAGPGEPGEIVVSGEHVSTGYLEGSSDQEAKFRVDSRVWHRTGDAGYIDSHGRLWLLGRSVARIHDRHGTLYPFAVECALSWHMGVRRAAAIAFHGRRLLLVESSRRVSRESILAGLPDESFFDAVRIWRRRRIPVDKRHNAKIDYTALSRRLERERRRTSLLPARFGAFLAYVYHETSQTAKRAQVLSPLRPTGHQPHMGMASEQSLDSDPSFKPSQRRSQTDVYAGTEA
jgi:acyl-CoA synthetase (AMP-forming)/AMP-acid ligase II